jgi:transposase
MAPQEYSWEVRERAKELYVVDGLTFEQVAAGTGVSVSQLKRWSADEKDWAEAQAKDPEEKERAQDWPEARKAFRLALGVIRRDSTLLRAKLITNALGGGEFKQVLSAAMWEKTQAHKDLDVGRASRPPASDGSQAGTPAPLAGGTPALPNIKTPQEAVAALEAVVVQRINLMATRPELLSFNAIKDLQKTLGLIEELKSKYRPEAGEGSAPGLSDEAAEEIRRQILGVS